MILRRVGVLSCGKVAGVLYGLLGLVFGVLLALVSLFGVGVAATQTAQSGTLLSFGALFGVGAVIFVPLLYGALGFVGGIITAALYNLVARWVGGVELHLE